ncbi:MAG: hypothetical protein EXR98_18925 [Gemmataceae bacterium]|nr:hypothetical protein [Gemmataceae bacterium]
MAWTNWQGAISRGAVLVLLLGSGLAWTQTPDRPAADPAERIMVVHENGKSTRCRVLESWQLPDGRVAHLLEALASGERITIVDDQIPVGEKISNPRAMPKRIFAWGVGRKTPPHDSPIPTHLRQDSGIVIKNESPAPSGAVLIGGPAITNCVYDKAIGGSKTPIPTVQDDPATRLGQEVEDYLAQQNKSGDRKLPEKIEKMGKSPETQKPQPTPLAILNPSAAKDEKPAVPAATGGPKNTDVKRDMWGEGSKTPLQPGKSLLDQTGVKPELVKLPPPQGRTNDPLMSPERLILKDDRLAPKGASGPLGRNDQPPQGGGIPPFARYDLPPVDQGIPLGAQSVLAAKAGLLGPVTYLPVPTVTVPQPNSPPMPPPPQMPEAPQLNANVNAFSQPVAPRTPEQVPWQNSGAFSNPQAAQQQILAQQAMMQYGYAMHPYMQQNRMPPMMAYGNPMTTQGPMTNYSRHYGGPMAPNPFAANPSVQTGYAPQGYPQQSYQQQAPVHATMPQQQPQKPVTQQATHQQVPTQAQAITQQVEQLIRVLRESSFPAQREWAAQSLASYEWRSHPQIVPTLLQSASQDPAASVRAGCVYCLGRMNAGVEPVFGVLHALRNDIDPRVRQEVAAAFTRLGQN